MLSEKQMEKIEKRILATVKLFFANEGKISDEELARIVSISGEETSSSTVGRDLTSDKTKELIGEKDFNLILSMRAQNKLDGKQKGGIISSNKNNITKNENGKFTGCERRKM